VRVPRLGVTAVCTAIAVTVAGVRLLAPVPLEVLDRKFLDFRHLVRGPLAASDQIVIVAIDEQSLTRLGRWPWPRARLAELVDRLDAAGVAAIGFDVVLDQPATSVDRRALEAVLDADPRRPAAALREVVRDELDDDARLASALRRSGHVALAHFFEFGGSAPPELLQTTAALPELTVLAVAGANLADVPGPPVATRARLPVGPLARAAAGTGHINFAPDPDGVYRRLPIAVRVGDRLVPSLALELVRISRGTPTTVTVAPEGLRQARAGALELPVDGAGQLWLDFLGPPRTVATVGAADVLDGQVSADRLAGRIALVGFTAAGFDEVTTPFAAVVPGVELQATVLDNVLQQRALHRPWWLVPAEALVIVGLGLIVGPALRWLHGGWGTAAAIALAVVYFWITQSLFTGTGLALGGLYPLVALVACMAGGAAYLSVVEEAEKRRVRAAFRHYVNPEIADLLAREPARLRLGGERRLISVLFSDIRGFTGIAEHLPPETLGEMLSQYLEAMTDVVFAHGGLLDKYIGDAVMAFWGAPVPADDHAARCCRAALDMLTALEQLNRRWSEAGLPRLGIRIGISSGNAIVGNFGSSLRFSYTAVGDTVNLASRLERLNKEFGTVVLISDDTRAAIGDEFVCREVGHTTVRGRTRGTTVHELVGRRSDAGAADPGALSAVEETSG
jgi:adenylate cyclase